MHCGTKAFLFSDVTDCATHSFPQTDDYFMPFRPQAEKPGSAAKAAEKATAQEL
jgi:hypothetical protein